ncbi:MAG: radical SAM protein, partial [Syntrophobacteraceae bacterium]
SMTYWYPGVVEAIAQLRELRPGVPIWLGGIYARLCGEHAARRSGADAVVPLRIPELATRLEAALGIAFRNRPCWDSFEAAPGPALELVPNLRYAPLVTGIGCPYRCPYCASGILQPVNGKKSADAIVAEIEHWHEERGVVDFAFYDDALLLNAGRGLKPALERICRDGPAVRFHVPNALHVRALTPEWCRLLFDSGFTTLRLGLETTRPERQKDWGGKVETEMFLAAVERLHEAGFSTGNIGVYLLCGLPGQTPGEVAEAIETVRRSGAQPHLAEYSPVPGTPMWREALAVSPFDIAGEPLYHNNTFFACRRPDFTRQDLAALKRLAREARHGGIEAEE